MWILNKDLIKKSEDSAVASGAFSYRALMLNAGTAAVEIILSKLSVSGKKVAVLCGKGNNGGDGAVIADLLYGHGADVTVITPFGTPTTENAKYYYDKLQFVKITDSFSHTDNYDIIIDALFGIGFSRQPDSTTLNLFKEINSHKGIKVSVDIPSGVECDKGKVFETAVKADYTITFIAPKPCFYLPDGSDYCGEVTVCDIGVKPLDYTYLSTEKPVFPKRRHNSHKGSYGTALMICGSYGMAGAAILSAKAALRSGLGIAKCVICDGIYAPFTSAVPEAVCVPVQQTASGILDSNEIDIKDLASRCTAILFGCGVGKGKDIEIILKKILRDTNLPTVIDADGINALCLDIDILKKSKAEIILTPHSGEMARLCGITAREVEADRVKIAQDFAKEYGCVLILKGADTIVALPSGEIFFNTTGNPGMATGGSGDVLAGITVSLLVQGFSPADAAKAAVYLHGEAGDKATAQKGERAMLPSDIIEQL